MPKDDEEVTEEEEVKDDETGEEEEDKKGGEDETPAWAKGLADSVGKITSRLDALEDNKGSAAEEDEDDEEKEEEDETEFKPGMSMDKFVSAIEKRTTKNILKALDSREKQKDQTREQVADYYNKQVQKIKDLGRDVNPKTQREVFQYMRDNKITSFVEGYFEWAESGGGQKKKGDETDEKRKGKSRRISSPGGDRKNKDKDKVYRPGQTVHDALAEIMAEEDME